MKYGDPEKGKIYSTHSDRLKWIEDLLLDLDFLTSASECVIWPFRRNSKGYASIQINKKQHYVHRLICERYHGPAENFEFVVRHLCGKGHMGCVNPEHLRWGTDKDNSEDAQLHGTVSRGTKRWNNKFSEEDILNIRARFVNGEKQINIAKDYDVHRSHISLICSRKIWNWI